MLRFSRNLFFSTTLIPARNPKPDQWWYYGVEHGQHVSLYTKKSLSLIAEKFRLNLYSDGSQIHLLTEKRLSSFSFNMVSRYKVALLLGMIFRNKTLLPSDYHQVTGKHLE